MLRGHLDALVSSGYFHGWAYDDESPLKPLMVSIRDGAGHEVASGLAHRFRADLADAKCGVGWCAFVLRTSESPGSLRDSAFTLLERDSARTIFSIDKISFIDVPEITLNSVDAAVSLDPTCINASDELSGCDEMLEAFVRSFGVDVFVRTAYVYVLSRAADPAGLATYGKLIRQRQMSPYAMIQTLTGSMEFRSRPRSLPAPNMPGFPFVWG